MVSLRLLDILTLGPEAACYSPLHLHGPRAAGGEAEQRKGVFSEELRAQQVDLVQQNVNRSFSGRRHLHCGAQPMIAISTAVADRQPSTTTPLSHPQRAPPLAQESPAPPQIAR